LSLIPFTRRRRRRRATCLDERDSGK